MSENKNENLKKLFYLRDEYKNFIPSNYFFESDENEFTLKGTYLWIFTYPCYRLFQEIKLISLQTLSKDFYIPKLKEIKQLIKLRNGYYTGFLSFMIFKSIDINSEKIRNFIIKDYQFMNLIFDYINRTIERDNIHDLITYYLDLSLCCFICYPFLKNSNDKVMFYDKNKNFKNFPKFSNLLNGFYYKGFSIFYMNFIISKIFPINFIICPKLESIRLAYIYGTNSKGNEFNSYREAYNFLKENNTLNKGRLFYWIIMLNLYISLKNDKQNKKENFKIQIYY